MATVTVQALRDQVRGHTITPDDSDYDDARRVYNAMIDRRPNVIVRAASVDDVVAGVNYAAGQRTCARRARRVAQRAGVRDRRRRGRDRPVDRMQQVEVDAAPADRAGAGRRDLGRVQRRHPRPRARHDRRHHLDHRRRRPHARRRHRLPRARLRAVLRQPALGRGRDRGRQAYVASDAGRNADLFWALRGGGGNFGVVTAFEYDLHPVAEIYGGPMFFELSDARRRPALVPRVHQGRPGAARRLPRLADRAAAAVHPRGSARRAVHGLRLLLGRAARRGRGGDQVAARRGQAGGRARGADALPGAQQRVRRAGPARAAALLEGELRQGAHRRRDRRPPRARAEGPDRQLDRPHLPDQRRLPPGGARATRRSPTATRRSPP